MLLEAGEIASNERSPVRYVSGTLFFEPDARRASARFFEWVRKAEVRAGGDARRAAVSLCGPDYEDFLESNKEEEKANAPRVERFGAAGAYEIACEVASRRAQAADELPPHSPSKKILRVFLVRDITGAVAAVALEFLV